MNIIAIDCGASYIKGASFRNGKKEKELREAAPGVSRNPLRTTDKIKKLSEIFKRFVIELAVEGAENLLCISNEMHGFVLETKKGALITDYVSWQIDLGDQLLRSNDEIRSIVRNTGMPIRGGLPSCNLSWIIHNVLLNGEVCFYTLGDYLIHSLTGKQPLIHHSNAAATGLFDLMSASWNKELIHYIGADSIILPTVSNEKIECEIEEKKLIIVPAIGDQQAALLGAGFFNMDTLSFNMGTGAQVSRLSDEIVFSTEWQVRPYFHNKYLITVPHIPSGRAINVYFRCIKSILDRYGVSISDPAVWEGISAAIKDGKKTSIKMDLGFFENAINESITGSVTGIEEDSLTMENLFYAIMNQMANNMCVAADRIWPDRATVGIVLYTGGVAERFAMLREQISSRYIYSKALCVPGDTLEGLFRYGKMWLGE